MSTEIYDELIYRSLDSIHAVLVKFCVSLKGWRKRKRVMARERGTSIL